MPIATNATKILARIMLADCMHDMPQGHADMMQASLHASQDDHKQTEFTDWVQLMHLKTQPVVCVDFSDLVPDLATAGLPCGLLRSVSLKTGCIVIPTLSVSKHKAVKPCT